MAFTIPSKKQLDPALWVLLGAAVLAGSWFRLFDLYELQTYDWRCQLRGERPTSTDIAVIEIEEITLDNLGKWPFDREYHAQLVDCLHKLGAKATVFDILFVEPSPSDALMADVTQSAGNVYFATALADPHSEGGIFVAEKVEAPLTAPFAKAAKGIGYVNVKTDIDGKRRRIYPVLRLDGKHSYHLSVRAAMDYLGVPAGEVRFEKGHLKLGDERNLPLDSEGHFLVNFAGRWRTVFKHYSFVQVLYAFDQMQRGEEPILDLSELKGKVCFVGLSALGSHDTSPIPIQPVYPMMGLYANVLNSILMKDYLVRLDRVWNLIILALGSAWILFLCRRFKPMPALVRVLITLSLFLGAGLALFIGRGVWIDLFYPLAVFGAIYAIAILRRALFEMKKRELIEGELRIASQIQQSFLPEKLPTEKGIDIAVFMKPAKAVGGDLYSFMPLGDGRLGVMVGDVSGKGPPAALFMAKAVSEFKFSARNHQEPSEVLTLLNDSIASESTGGLFVTLTYAIFDVIRCKIVISNGGHLPLVTVNRSGETGLVTAEEGMPIGVLGGVPFSANEVDLREGDCFAFYSDGVSEARNRRKDEWGVEALQKVMAEHRSASAQEILERSVEQLNHFMGRAEQHDDITLIIVKISALRGAEGTAAGAEHGKG